MKFKKSQLKRSMLAIAIGASLTIGSVASVSALQGGAIKGKVTAQANSNALEGILVTATSNVMPKPRTSITKADGSYSLPLLIPGTYKLTFTAKDGTVRETTVEVLLDQTTRMNYVVKSEVVDNIEVITVTGSSIVREGDSALTNSIGAKVVESVPVGQDYRSLMKLIPGVQYSENAVLGPSAGGSGRDNKYGFDGVDVSLPMFGNLASEPSTHDIQSVSMDRGGAKAVGFNRSGGFAINTVSKSGTNEFHGRVEYRMQPKEFVADKDDTDGTKFEENKTWITTSLSGPIIEDELFFYGSYYRPEVTRDNKETAYGPTKDFKSVRNEYFGKLTYAPTDELLFNLSYRTSERTEKGDSVGAFDHDSTSKGSSAEQDIFTVDGSYLIGDYTTLTFQYSQFKLVTSGGPDTLFPNVIPKLGDSLDLAMLDQLGEFGVPELDLDDADFDNAGAQVLIDQYGYVGDDGMMHGGGNIGGASQIDNIDYFRDSFEVALDHELELGNAIHNLHFGFKWSEGTEELGRLSNGWGSLSYIGGLTPDDYTGTADVYYQTRTQQMSFLDDTGGVVSPIVSKSEMFNIEINDSIEYGDFTFNIGVLISKDVLYGQGLKAKSGTVSGFEVAPGHEYKMHTTDFKDMIQPRLGVTWEYEADSTIFANFASYNPEASSLARAASWARNTRKTLKVFFDENGDYLSNDPASGSSGKFFQDGIKPRRIDEITIGTTKLVTDNLFVRSHVRYKEGQHFWEDTWNGSRGYGEYGPFGGVPAHIAEKGLYIPNLSDVRDEIGGSSYVIAELDDSYTKYWEVNFEAEYTGERYYLNASYVYSHYYGNFDADRVSGASDDNLFIGSSNLADGRGRQLWDGKDGDLSGDKPHVFKAFGYYTLDWEANLGAYFVYQSGEAWERWDGSLYGYSSSTIRYAETAGTRRSASHWQIDLNYTQDFVVSNDITVKFQADLFNIFDNQTGYNPNPYASSETFGQSRSQYNPRRLQLTASVEF
jgi:hypothetical protein